mgnify:CR=1 FL=1
MFLFPVFHKVKETEYSFSVKQDPPKGRAAEIIQYSAPIEGNDAAFKYTVFLKSADILASQAPKNIVEELVASKVMEVLNQEVFQDQAFFITGPEIKDAVMKV